VSILPISLFGGLNELAESLFSDEPILLPIDAFVRCLLVGTGLLNGRVGSKNRGNDVLESSAIFSVSKPRILYIVSSLAVYGKTVEARY
jgi:hypothetical protein